jgi:spermidine/putrescine transport system permease protein
MSDASHRLDEPSRLLALLRSIASPGVLNAVPPLLLFLTGFLGPLVLVGLTSFIPARTFGFHGDWTLENYSQLFAEGSSHYIPFLWSFGLAAACVAFLLMICYPIAYGMAKVFGKWASPITLLLVLPLFVSENVRLFGWVIFLMKGGGIFAGIMKTLFGLDPGSMLYTPAVVLFGLCYVYLPFMLFPIVLGVSMIPKDLVESANDLGASRFQMFREIEVPLAMPGLLVGGLLTFILAVGAISETTILGGQNISVVALDIRHEFTYNQNWPGGSAIAMLVTVLTGVLVMTLLNRLNLDRLLGKR